MKHHSVLGQQRQTRLGEPIVDRVFPGRGKELAAHSFGAGDHPAAGRVAGGGLIVATAVAAPMMATLLVVPPLPMRSRPTSNCGLIIASASKRSAQQSNTAGSTLVREMKDTSATTRSGR